MNAVVRVAYKLPDDFPDILGDLVQKLVVCCFLDWILSLILSFFSVVNRVNVSAVNKWAA